MDLVPRVLGLLVQGSSSGWWGLGCPAHCSFSFPLAASLILSGFALGTLCTLLFFKDILFVQPPRVSHRSGPEVPPGAPGVQRRAARLAAYLRD